jgi:hemerythrin superfamily protein
MRLPASAARRSLEGVARRRGDIVPDVVDLITQDHRELERMFDVLQKEPDKRAAMTPVMTTLLFAHSRAEESEVYPRARAAGVEEDVEHSQKEHLVADQLAEKLVGCDPDAPEYGEALDKLVEAVKHHLEEEEETLLPDMRSRMSQDDLESLGERFLAAREEGLGSQPDDMTKEQLSQQAENAEVSGTTGLGKEQLKERLSEEAEL